MKIVIALALFLAAAPVAALVPRPPYRSNLVAVTPLAGGPAGSQAFTIRYGMRGDNGEATEATGVVIVPRGPAPAGGRDVVAWAHGTSGIADQCAPSVNPWLFDSIAGLEAMLARGYVVVATDYEGLGSPGPHPYLIGRSAARSVIFAVSAAHEIPAARTSGRYVVWGESQGGHAALWTGLYGPVDDFPGQRLMGVAASAPPTDLKANLSGNSNPAVRALLTAMTAESWHETYGIPLSTITRPVGSDLIRRLAMNCVTLDGFKLRTKIGLMRLIGQLRGVDLGASPPWAALMKANSVAPVRFTVPVLIAQGGKDVIVAPEVTRRYVDALCRTGQRVRFLHPDANDHVTIAKNTAAETIDWIGDRFAGRPDPDDCGSLR
jgi:alpha-beta hydrolase superfamily lysophospholipase